MSRSKRNLNRLLSSCAVLLLFSGCTNLNPSKIPGEPSGDVPYLETSQVLTAIKIQLAEELKTIEQEHFNNVKTRPRTSEGKWLPVATDQFQLKIGNGTFSGKTQVVDTGDGVVAAVIPFTGYAGSILTPSLGASGSTNSTQDMKLTFKIDPSMSKPVSKVDSGNRYSVLWKDFPPKMVLEPSGEEEKEAIKKFQMFEADAQEFEAGSSERKELEKQANEAWKIKTKQRQEKIALEFDPSFLPASLDWKPLPTLEKSDATIEVGTFVRDALRASFNESKKMFSYAGTSPGITNSEIKISLSFVVVRKIEAGVRGFVVVPAPDLNSITGSLGADRQKTATYTLDLTFPMFANSSSDARRLYYTKEVAEGYITVEEPYTEERYLEMTEDAHDGDRGVQNFSTKGAGAGRLPLPPRLRPQSVPPSF